VSGCVSDDTVWCHQNKVMLFTNFRLVKNYVQGVVDKVTLLVVDSKQTPVEKFVFRLGLKQPSSAGVPVQHLEFALRGFLLKLSASDALLLPLPSGSKSAPRSEIVVLTWFYQKPKPCSLMSSHVARRIPLPLTRYVAVYE
jgi:hypothetical protein